MPFDRYIPYSLILTFFLESSCASHVAEYEVPSDLCSHFGLWFSKVLIMELNIHAGMACHLKMAAS